MLQRLPLVGADRTALAARSTRYSEGRVTLVPTAVVMYGGASETSIRVYACYSYV